MTGIAYLKPNQTCAFWAPPGALANKDKTGLTIVSNVPKPPSPLAVWTGSEWDNAAELSYKVKSAKKIQLTKLNQEIIDIIIEYMTNNGTITPSMQAKIDERQALIDELKI